MTDDNYPTINDTNIFSRKCLSDDTAIIQNIFWQINFHHLSIKAQLYGNKLMI